ncbi:GntR family transcriptional regulator [Streptomyces sp. NPDC047000]|uniref:GntR family transcriptional regulator n=1 Tax=Streptomyces sp. NPDC047000 TaxID=3155474 RepID=UPI003409ACA0
MGSAASGPEMTASRRIAEIIRARILDGELRPGTRIRQDDLAEELNASRLPVREALRMLESGGLVTLRSNRGAWVSSLDQHDCELSYTMRERLEPLLLAESMGKITADDVNDLRGLQDRIERSEEVEDFLRLDREFHWLSYRHHNARELATIIARLWDTTQHYRRAYSRLAHHDRRWVINSEHRLLIASIEDGDCEMAQRVLETHIGRTRRALRAHPEIFTD